jgi:hypothetical protein
MIVDIGEEPRRNGGADDLLPERLAIVRGWV